MSEAKQFVKDLKDKEAVNSVFLATDKTVLTDRNGKSYMSFNLTDASGTVNARVWDKVEDWTRVFEAGDFVRIKGHVQTYQNRRQIIVHDIQKASGESVSLKDFVGASVEDPLSMFARLEKLIASFEDAQIRKLLQLIVSEPEAKNLLMRSPAAKSIHHAYLGGLLEHVLSICEIMEFLAKHYPFLNRDLLIFGAIFHDIGKIYELAFENGIKYTDRGRLVGHMAIACEMIGKHAGEVEGLEQGKIDILKHIVLSHHGKLEYGSPKLPALPEAMIVAMIDELDSKLNTVVKFMRGELDSGESWTRLSPQFDRYFYLEFLRSKERTGP